MNATEQTKLRRYVFTIKVPTVLRYQRVTLKLRGAYWAESGAEAWSALSQAGFNALDVKGPEAKGHVPQAIRNGNELELLNSWFITILRSGVPLPEGLRALADGSPNVRLRVCLNLLASDIDGGMPPAEAFQRQPHAFPPALAAAFLSGNPVEQLALYSRSELSWRHHLARISQLLLYPAILLTMLTLVSLVYRFTTAPTFTKIAAEIDMPFGSTIAEQLIALLPWLFYALVLIAAAAMLFKLIQPRRFQTLLASLPGLSAVSGQARLATVCRLVKLNLGPDQNLVQALRATAQAGHGRSLEKRLLTASARLELGEEPHLVLQDQLHPLIGAFVRLRNDMAGALELAATVFDERSAAALLRLRKIIIPSLVAGICVLAGLFVIHFYGFVLGLPSALLRQM